MPSVLPRCYAGPPDVRALRTGLRPLARIEASPEGHSIATQSHQAGGAVPASMGDGTATADRGHILARLLRMRRRYRGAGTVSAEWALQMSRVWRATSHRSGNRMTAEHIAQGLRKARKSGAGWMACCPCHEDTNPSLHLTDSRNGKVLAKCFAGCPQEALVTALGLHSADSSREYPADWGHLVRTYDYVDEHGTILYQVARFDPKNFRQRRPAGDGWRWGIAGVRRVLYRLPELIEAPIAFIAEGEKDVEALRDFGFCATCNSGGAGKWRPEFNQFFTDKEVCILPDADSPGWKHALDIARGIVGIAAKVQILELPGAKDPAEWFGQGHGELELIELLEAPCHQ